MKMNEHARAWSHDYVANLLGHSALPAERRSSVHWEILNHLHEASERIALGREATEISLADVQQAVKEAGGFAGLSGVFLHAPVVALPRAAFGRRAAAFLVDLVLAATAGFLAFFSFVVITEWIFTDWFGYGFIEMLAFFWFITILAGVALAFASFEYRFGATPGKMAFKLRTVRADGSSVPLHAAIVRNVAKVIPPLFLLDVLLYLLAFRQDEQRASDRIANTIVVDTSRSMYSPTGARGPPRSYPPLEPYPPMP